MILDFIDNINWATTWESVSSDMSAQLRLKPPCTCTQSDQSLRYLYEETSHLWLSKMCPVKILIRLRKCEVWSESSLGHMSEGHFLMLLSAYLGHIITWRNSCDETDCELPKLRIGPLHPNHLDRQARVNNVDQECCVTVRLIRSAQFATHPAILTLKLPITTIVVCFVICLWF